MNAECARCGVTAADLPYEDLGLSVDEASELLFEAVDGWRMCKGCAQIPEPAGGASKMEELPEDDEDSSMATIVEEQRG